MLRQDLKPAVHALKPMNLSELKQLCKQWAKILPYQMMGSVWLQLLLLNVVQRVIKLKGAITFSHVQWSLLY